MSFIGKNIKKIRTVKNLSQAGFAQLFNLARPSVGAYEEGRSEPKMETVVQIARHFGVSIDLLLTKELTVNELYNFDIFKQEQVGGKLLIKVATPAEQTAPAARLVKASASPEYLAHRHDPAYLAQLPDVNFPISWEKTIRAFEQSGDEMLYRDQGIVSGDVLLGELIDPEFYRQLTPGLVYVAVLEKRISVRRLSEISIKGNLCMKADNPDYGLLEIDPKEILELWEVRGVFSTRLRMPGTLDERLSTLENTVQALNSRLKNIEVK